MAKTTLTLQKSNPIYNICYFGSLFVMTICLTDLKDMTWWRYAIGIGAWMVLAYLYPLVFKRFVCPKEIDTKKISQHEKNKGIVIAILLTLASISLFSFLPFSFGANLAISIIFNFIVVMSYCYYFVKNLKE